MAAKEKESKAYVSNGLGRRKSSVARVYLAEGTGKIVINKRDIRSYFPKATNRYVVNQPLLLLKLSDKYDFNINVKGGGINGQAEAVRLAISRALVEFNEEFKSTLKAKGLMTRDPRMVERKKFGQKKARKKFQFSKR